MRVERTTAQLMFYLVMLFVLVAALDTRGLTVITEPLNALLTRVAEFAPRLVAGGALLAVAWLLATGARRLVEVGLGGTRWGRRMSDSWADEAGDGATLCRSLGEGAYGLVFLLFLPAVLGALALDGLRSPVQNVPSQRPVHRQRGDPSPLRVDARIPGQVPALPSFRVESRTATEPEGTAPVQRAGEHGGGRQERLRRSRDRVRRAAGGGDDRIGRPPATVRIRTILRGRPQHDPAFWSGRWEHTPAPARGRHHPVELVAVDHDGNRPGRAT